MIAFYNEIDPYCCAWLSNLMDAGLITPGVISNESIEDLTPNELIGYDRVHFFAGIGGWDYALNLAGWGERPVWTGSCPCQPFSAAGKGAGFADERHLWPQFHYLIEQCRPAVVFGEQVASKDGLDWLDLVQADLEGTGYATAAADLCAAGIGAPHIRQRLYWVADSAGARSLPGAYSGIHRGEKGTGSRDAEPERFGAAYGMGDQQQQGLQERIGNAGIPSGTIGTFTGQTVERTSIHSVRLADNRLPESSGRDDLTQGLQHRGGNARRIAPSCGTPDRPGPTNGFWRDADWLFCRDDKWRPVEPGTFPLAHGIPARVGELRAYGNAIVPQVAQVFIESYLYEI